MRGYDSWHWEDEQLVCEGALEITSHPDGSVSVRNMPRDRADETKTDALVDIAYDCASLEAAQARAREALKGTR